MTEHAFAFLTVAEVCELYVQQIFLFGGTEGIRNQGGLESAVAQAEAAFGGEYLHSDVFEMAAAYAFHIAENQPFLDGNKRAALSSALVFLHINGYVVVDSDDQLFNAMLAIARRDLDKAGLGRLLQKLSRRLTSEE